LSPSGPSPPSPLAPIDSRPADAIDSKACPFACPLGRPPTGMAASLSPSLCSSLFLPLSALLSLSHSLLSLSSLPTPHPSDPHLDHPLPDPNSKASLNLQAQPALHTHTHLQMNPNGKIPMLVTPAGPLYESNAICRFLATRGPGGPGIYPPPASPDVGALTGCMCVTRHGCTDWVHVYQQA